jgi:hypothetical protein
MDNEESQETTAIEAGLTAEKAWTPCLAALVLR